MARVVLELIGKERDNAIARSGKRESSWKGMEKVDPRRAEIIRALGRMGRQLTGRPVSVFTVPELKPTKGRQQVWGRVSFLVSDDGKPPEPMLTTITYTRREWDEI